MHILPPQFVKMRHYGILANRNKGKLRMLQLKMGIVRSNKAKTDWKGIAKAKLNFDVEACPCCKTGRMIRVMSFQAHAPPHLQGLKLKLKKNK